MTQPVPPTRGMADNNKRAAANDLAWREVLSTLQLNVVEGESYLEAARKAAEQGQTLDPPDLEFDPPANLGPMPGDFADWAKDLLQRQERLGELLGETVRAVRAQHDALTKPTKKDNEIPLYLDTSL